MGDLSGAKKGQIIRGLRASVTLTAQSLCVLTIKVFMIMVTQVFSQLLGVLKINCNDLIMQHYYVIFIVFRGIFHPNIRTLS